MAKNNWYKRKINGTIETSPKKRQIVAGRTDTEFGVGSEMGTPESEPGVVSEVTIDNVVGIEVSTTSSGLGVGIGVANVLGWHYGGQH